MTEDSIYEYSIIVYIVRKENVSVKDWQLQLLLPGLLLLNHAFVTMCIQIAPHGNLTYRTQGRRNRGVGAQ